MAVAPVDIAEVAPALLALGQGSLDRREGSGERIIERVRGGGPGSLVPGMFAGTATAPSEAVGSAAERAAALGAARAEAAALFEETDALFEAHLGGIGITLFLPAGSPVGAAARSFAFGGRRLGVYRLGPRCSVRLGLAGFLLVRGLVTVADVVEAQDDHGAQSGEDESDGGKQGAAGIGAGGGTPFTQPESVVHFEGAVGGVPVFEPLAAIGQRAKEDGPCFQFMQRHQSPV